MTVHSRQSHQDGIMTLYVLIFASVAFIVISGFVIWADSALKQSYRDIDRAQAFMAAESGIEYYRWHLARAPKDYQDGTGKAGPYTHQLLDKDGNAIGSFSLTIATPPTGSTVVDLVASGSVTTDATVIRAVEAKMAIASFTKYAADVGGFLWYPEGTEVFGPVHANGGIRFDGYAHNIVTSSVATFNDPTHGGGSSEFGVHTHKSPVDPFPPAAVPDRPDVFGAGRQFPVAPVNFAGLTENLASLSAFALADHAYWGPQTNKKYGYHVVLRTDGKFDLYEVTGLVNPPNNCVTVKGEKDWGTWSISTQNKLGTYSYPAGGTMFFGADVWVDGQISNAHLTIGAGVFPEQSNNLKNIIVNHNLTYTNYDGKDAIGLVAQNNVNVGLVSDDVLRIDGALVAHAGQVGRYYYKPASGNNNQGCSPYDVRQSITLYGLVASQQTYGFQYDDNTGYQKITIIYDASLQYGPPPNFPLTSTFYSPIFWNEK